MKWPRSEKCQTVCIAYYQDAEPKSIRYAFPSSPKASREFPP